MLCYREEHLLSLPHNNTPHSFLWSYLQGKTLREELHKIIQSILCSLNPFMAWIGDLLS